MLELSAHISLRKKDTSMIGLQSIVDMMPDIIKIS